MASNSKVSKMDLPPGLNDESTDEEYDDEDEKQTRVKSSAGTLTLAPHIHN